MANGRDGRRTTAAVTVTVRVTVTVTGRVSGAVTDGESPMSGDVDRGTRGNRHVSIEIVEPPAPDESPELEPATRVDTMVKDRLLPTARLDDGRYVAWWFDTDAPGPYDAATTEWVIAPTRFLAAATFRELTEDPARFDALVSADDEGVVE
jgi:hypothetical protein